MMDEKTKNRVGYTGINPTTRRELERLMKIAAAVGGLDSAAAWLSDRLEAHEPEPDWHAGEVKWIKWYRNLHGASLKEAVDEGRRRYAQS